MSTTTPTARIREPLVSTELDLCTVHTSRRTCSRPPKVWTPSRTGSWTRTDPAEAGLAFRFTGTVTDLELLVERYFDNDLEEAADSGLMPPRTSECLVCGAEIHYDPSPTMWVNTDRVMWFHSRIDDGSHDPL